MKTFFDGLDEDIRLKLKEQLRDLWTHTSTAIEGNSLTLDETAFVLKEGLTISGKPLKDHQEVTGHARAIEIIYGMLDKDSISEKDLFKLHEAVQIKSITDIYSPVGAWKKEENGTYVVDEKGKQIFKYFAAPDDVPCLMDRWISKFNELYGKAKSDSEALNSYVYLHISFTRIHPFYDGNGRIARLVSNLPVLKTGLPPIIISKEKRYEYIKTLSFYDLAVGIPSRENPELLPSHPKIDEFTSLVSAEWENAVSLVENARMEQDKRRNIQKPNIDSGSKGMKITPY
ncbi:MAG: Fic family protein [Victivallales bacterium]